MSPSLAKIFAHTVFSTKDRFGALLPSLRISSGPWAVSLTALLCLAPEGTHAATAAAGRPPIRGDLGKADLFTRWSAELSGERGKATEHPLPHSGRKGGLPALPHGLAKGAAATASPSAPALITAAPVSAFGFVRPPSAPMPHFAVRASTAAAAAVPSIVLDRSLGQTGQPAVSKNSNGRNDYAVTGSLGKQIGQNLYFSFQNFGLSAGESATFSDPGAAIRNILARVTGGSRSVIDGTISSEIPGANFFLLNPAGVLFGAGAALQLGGSFVVSTADNVKLADGAIFGAVPSANDAHLSAAEAAGFGFVKPMPAGVEFDGAKLSVQPGRGVDVIAGSITLNAASITAPSGALTMFSASSAGEVPWSPVSPGAEYGKATPGAAGAIRASNGSSLSIDGNGGGSVVLSGGAVTLDGSAISSTNSGRAAGGSIEIQAQTLSVTGGGKIGTAASGSGDGGNLTIGVRDAATISSAGKLSTDTDSGGRGGNLELTAGSLTIDGSGTPGLFTGIGAQSHPGATGGAGNLTVKVSGTLSIVKGGTVSADTFSADRGGNVDVTAGSLAIEGAGTASVVTGITAQSDPGATGDAGTLTVRVANALSLTGDGSISAQTLSSGRGGDLSVVAGSMRILSGSLVTAGTASSGASGNAVVVAGSLVIDGSSVFNRQTGISATSEPGATGNAGDLTVRVAGDLEITGRGEISGSAFSAGNGGTLVVTAGNLRIDGSKAPGDFTGITTASNSQATGNAGDASITVANALSITGGGQISSSTFSTGRGGNLTVTAANLTIGSATAPSNPNSTGIFSGSEASGAGGKAGDLTVKVTNDLILTGGGEINTDTVSSGDSGKLTVRAGGLTIDGSGAPNLFTGISVLSNAGATGNTGDLTVNVAGALTIAGSGQISANTYSTGNSGKLAVTAETMSIDGSATPTLLTGVFAESDATGKGGNAGDLTVNVSRTLMIAGAGEISADTSSSGNSGRLTVTAGALTLDGTAAPEQFTGISADSNAGATGNAGDLTVKVKNSLKILGSADIDASTYSLGRGGNLSVTASSLVIDGTATASNPNANQPGILAESDATGPGGNAGKLTVRVQKDLMIFGGGEISADTYSSGNSGNLTVAAGSLSIDGSAATSSFTGITAASESGATGNAGDLTVQVAHLLKITGSGEIGTDTFSSGSSGRLTVAAGALSIDGSAALNLFTGITAASDSGATGNAGDLNVAVANGLTIFGGGEINASTSSTGGGGNLTVSASWLSINGSTDASNLNVSGILAESDASGTGGNAGSLTVRVANALAITAGGQISANTYSTGQSGKLTITAGSLSIDGSAAASQFTGVFAESDAIGQGGNAGDLRVSVRNGLNIIGSGEISADTSSSGNSGELTVTAGALSIDGSATPAFFTGIAAASNVGATGNAGDLNVIVTGALKLTGSGQITASTSSTGRGGNLAVTASSLAIDGSATVSNPNASQTGLLAESLASGPGGPGGSLTVEIARGLTISGGGKISASTSSSGDSGQLTIAAGDAIINGAGSGGSFTGVSAASNTGATGNAGDLVFNVARKLTILDHGEIGAGTFSSGKSGNVTVAAGDLTIDGSADPAQFTGIDAQSNSDATGNAGNVTIKVTGSLNLAGSGEISASTFSAGRGGDLSVNAGSLYIDGSATPGDFTGLTAESDMGAAGRGGDVRVKSDQATITGGGAISAVSKNAAPSGSIDLAVNSLDLNSGGTISSANTSSGAAGSVTVRVAGSAEIDGNASVSTAARLGNAGDIQIRAGGDIDLRDGGSVVSSAGANGGNVTLTSRGMVYLLDGSITATAGAQRLGGGKAGQGGNITIDPEFIILDHSLISANAAAGQGGNILLDSQYYFSSESLVTATGSTAGTITITSPELDLTNGLVQLPGSLLDASSQMRELCALRVGADFSSFLVLGAGGVEAGPDEAGADLARRKGQPKAE